jgi:hypothetical protein
MQGKLAHTIKAAFFFFSLHDFKSYLVAKSSSFLERQVHTAKEIFFAMFISQNFRRVATRRLLTKQLSFPLNLCSQIATALKIYPFVPAFL